MRVAAMALKVLCPAKVNLFLRVQGEREDGYHEIFSLIQPVTLYDEVSLTVKEGSGITVRTSGLSLPSGRGNLAYGAAELFLKEAGIEKEVTIEIDKRIPVSAGLGGGSSDAAGVLMGLNGFLGVGMGEERLMEVGLPLGSDVPFFILKSPALARGRGEMLERVVIPPCHYVLINPGFGVSSAWAYGSLDLTNIGRDNILADLKELSKDPEAVIKYLANDLEEAVISMYPALKELKGLLMEEGAKGALMSGSGPTVFGVFFRSGEAQRAYSAIKERLGPEYRVFLARGLSERTFL